LSTVNENIIISISIETEVNCDIDVGKLGIFIRSDREMMFVLLRRCGHVKPGWSGEAIRKWLFAAFWIACFVSLCDSVHVDIDC